MVTGEDTIEQYHRVNKQFAISGDNISSGNLFQAIISRVIKWSQQAANLLLLLLFGAICEWENYGY